MPHAQTSGPRRFFDEIDNIKREVSEKDIYFFLDYDGTLTPIVETPDKAILSEDMRKTIQSLSSHYTVSVVSGRATDDVRGKVKIDGIFYAGSHGFEIVDSHGHVDVNQEAQEVRATINEVHEKLSERLKNVDGALVENVKYTISTHYRLVSDSDFPVIKEAVDRILDEYPGLRVTEGKKVFEIRPKIDWDKGKAVEWILNVLKFDPQHHCAVYIGDDTTDEDAFAVLEGKGFGILVTDELRPTKAEYWIKDTEEVRQVLEYFIKG